MITPPAEEPVTLARLKAHCRVDGDADDDLLSVYLTAARERVEALSGRALVSQTLELSLSCWPSGGILRLPRAPLIDVDAIEYLDPNGLTIELDPSQYIAPSGEPARIGPASGTWWPAIAPSLGAVRIRWTAGYGGAEDVPARYVQAILLIVNHWYEERSASEDLPGAALALIGAGGDYA